MTRVEVHLADDNNSQKVGDKDKSCVMEARLAHAGRKASSKKSCDGGEHIGTGDRGWETIAPSRRNLLAEKQVE